LGAERISFLRGRSSADAWKYDLSESSPDLEAHPRFNPTEMMVVAAAREISSVVLARGYQTMLAGIGSPGLAAWLAFYLLKKENEHIDMLTGLGLVGYAPRPGDPFLMNLPNVMTCTMLTDTVEVYGTLVGGANNQCISVLGTAQIDKYGNINTVKIGDTPFIGLGGAGDAVNARETIIVTKQSRKRFLEKLTFEGCSGQSIKTLVTDLGIFKKLGDDEIFTLTKYFKIPSIGGKKERLREISDRCGWTVKAAGVLKEVLPPTAEELVMLRALDPRGFFIGK
jgi:glutaconate CoA-transferase subunit B